MGPPVSVLNWLTGTQKPKTSNRRQTLIRPRKFNCNENTGAANPEAACSLAARTPRKLVQRESRKPVGVWDRLSQFSFVRLTYQVCVSKKIGGATAESLKGLKCRGASLRRNHEAERDQEAIQSRNADRKRIGLWQLRLKYRGQRLASLCVPKRAGRCGGRLQT